MGRASDAPTKGVLPGCKARLAVLQAPSRRLMQALSLSSVMASSFCTRRDTTALILHRLRCSGRTPTAVSMCWRLRGMAQCQTSRWDPSKPVAGYSL